MIISDSAIAQIKKQNEFLVILVTIGGCRGLFYDMFFSQSSEGYFFLHDLVLTNEKSLPFLLDITLDFYFEIGYEDFVIKNEDINYCGCGKSFKGKMV